MRKKDKPQTFKHSHDVNRSKAFCSECNYLGRKLKLDINFTHNPADCPRPRAAINLLLAEEYTTAIDTEEEDEGLTGKNESTPHIDNSISSNYQMNRVTTPVVKIDDNGRNHTNQRSIV